MGLCRVIWVHPFVTESRGIVVDDELEFTNVMKVDGESRVRYLCWKGGNCITLYDHEIYIIRE